MNGYHPTQKREELHRNFADEKRREKAKAISHELTAISERLFSISEETKDVLPSAYTITDFLVAIERVERLALAYGLPALKYESDAEGAISNDT